MKNIVLIIREPDPSFNHHSDAFRRLSQRVRELANWKCEQCGINLDDDRRYLDAHHIWGTQYNALIDLEALCVGCHAEEKTPTDHSFMKEHERYKVFMNKYRK